MLLYEVADSVPGFQGDLQPIDNILSRVILPARGAFPRFPRGESTIKFWGHVKYTRLQKNGSSLCKNSLYKGFKLKYTPFPSKPVTRCTLYSLWLCTPIIAMQYSIKKNWFNLRKYVFCVFLNSPKNTKLYFILLVLYAKQQIVLLPLKNF